MMKYLMIVHFWLSCLVPALKAQFVSPGVAAPGLPGNTGERFCDSLIPVVSPGIILPDSPGGERYSGPYLGQTPPGDLPVRFAPPGLQANNQWFWHGSPSFSPDLTEMYFVKYFIATDKVHIYFMKMVNGIWTNPVPPSFSNPDYIENNPVFSPSGDTLYYYSQKPGGPYFYVVRDNGNWSDPCPLYIPFPDTLSPTWQFCITPSGRFYFDLWKQNGNIDIFYSDKVDGQYTWPVCLGPQINSPEMDWGACLDPQESILIFSSKRAGGSGLNDLYLSYRQGGDWSEPENLGPSVNGVNEDGFPRLSPDGQYFFFTTARNNDIGYNPYWVKASAVAPFMATGRPGHAFPGLSLEQNCPNPAHGKSVIRFSVPVTGHYRLSLYNLSGQELLILDEGEKAPGNYAVEAVPGGLSPGNYLYVLTSPSERLIKIMTVL